jgi:hypothetical protein
LKFIVDFNFINKPKFQLLSIRASMFLTKMNQEIARLKRRRSRHLGELQILIILLSIKQRSSPIPRIRWNSEYLQSLAIQESSFLSEYGMTFDGFNLLLEMLLPALEVCPHQAQRANPFSAPITSASRLAACLIELKGGRRMEVMRTHGIAKSTAAVNFKRTIRAINQLSALAIKCDASPEALRARAKRFEQRSTHKTFSFVTGAMDGLALSIRTPSKAKVMNQTNFYSGSKKKMCLNMQAVCDADAKFLIISCQHSGCTSDQEAFQTSSLKDIAMMHEFPYHLIADNAYSLTEVVMVPYSAFDHHEFPERESFNFWHSQLRITIERAFGIYVRRWGIFSRPSPYGLKFFCEIVEATCRLHNFCIDRNIPVPQLSPSGDGGLNRTVNEDGILIDPIWTENVEVPTVLRGPSSGSVLRDHITEEIARTPALHVVRSHHQ